MDLDDVPLAIFLRVDRPSASSAVAFGPDRPSTSAADGPERPMTSVDFRTVKSSKGKDLLVYKGCRFRSYRTSRNEIKWRCNESSKRSGEFRARVVTDRHLNLINECPPYVHNHELPTMDD